MAKIKIGSREIGAGCPVFIIAEVGNNWSTYDDCFASIVLAKKAGADAVKFQHFTPEELYGFDLYDLPIGPDGKSPCSDIRNRTWWEDLVSASLPEEWLKDLSAHARDFGMEFMCSAFSPEGVARVGPFVAAHKIASCEAVHPGIREACQKSGKPTFLSSGAVDRSEFLEIISESWPSGVIPTYCRASYPANDAQPWLWADIQMPKCFSDHSMDVFPCAVPLYGYQAIEKHVNFVGASGPDAAHSLSGDDFARMVKFLRYQLEDERPPEDIVKYHRRRLVTLPDGSHGWYRVPKGI